MTDPDAWGDHGLEDEHVVVGPWRFVLRSSEIADVAHRGVPVLRAVRFVTRDHDWRTADDELLVRELTVDEHDGTAQLCIEASSGYDGHEVLRYRLDVALDRGTLAVHAEATTTDTFRRNRIGLVALHPPQLAGVPFTVHHASGGTSEHTWPTVVAPHQPARDVAGYRWNVDGIDAVLTLGGDVFEMEDQRNWTDASYKTYSTPLSEPFPVALDAGSRITQTLTLNCGPDGLPGGAGNVSTRLPSVTVPVSPVAGSAATNDAPPTLQLLAGSAPVAARPADAVLLAGVPVLVEPELDHPDVAAVLAAARRDAGGAPLDVRFVTDDPDALRRAVDAVLASGPVVRVGAYDPSSHVTTPVLQRALVAAARAHGDLEAVAGARSHFTELNRTIESFGGWDGPLTFSVTPQMHDRSRAQVTESVRMQREVVGSASRLAAGRPLHVGPVTLRPRFNAVATSPRRPVTDASAADGYGPEFVADATDPAQHSAGAGVWFAASVAALSVPGVASITLAEAWGPRGVVASDGTRSPAALVFDMLR